MKTFLIGLFISVLAFYNTNYTQQKDDAAADTVLAKRFGVAAYPILFYTPETELGYGAGGMIFFKSSPIKKIRTSKIKVSAFLTSNKQYGVNIFPMIYFSGEQKFSLEGKLTYAKEIWKYYGLGNNSPDIQNPEYEQKTFRFYGELVAFGILSNHFQTGPIYEYHNAEITDPKNNPYLNSRQLMGKEGGAVSGIGWSFLLDLRNNIFYPTELGYYKVRLMWFNKSWGSDFDYSRFVVDLRQYIDLGNEHLLAMQLYYDHAEGNIPFYKLPQMGGETRMRGYFLGRYRDKKYITFQTEYRKIVWWRIGVTAFGAIGDVAGGFSHLKLTTKYTYGFGLRFVFDEDERLNVRMDIGFGENTDGIYFSLEEAF